MLQGLTSTMHHLQHRKKFATDLILQGATQRKLSTLVWGLDLSFEHICLVAQISCIKNCL